MPSNAIARARYGSKIRGLQSQLGRLERDGVRRALSILDDTRGDILSRLRANKDFPQFWLRELGTSVEHTLTEFQNRYTAAAQETNRQAKVLGHQFVEQPILAATELQFRIPDLPADLLEILQGTTADLVQLVTDRMRTKINTEVRATVVGIQRPQDAIDNLERALASKTFVKRGFRRHEDFAMQAERIVRTESSRVFQVSNDSSLRAAKEKIPDLKKQWKTNRDGRERASHHILHNEIREVNELFSNGLMYPLDPSGPPQEVIH